MVSKRCASKISWGVSEIRIKKTRLLHLGNVEKPHHPQFSAQRALRVNISEIHFNFSEKCKFLNKKLACIKNWVGTFEFGLQSFRLSCNFQLF